MNKFLAMSDPLLTGLAAIGSALSGHSPHGSWAAMIEIVDGVLASVVNTIEHGGQVGMERRENGVENSGFAASARHLFADIKVSLAKEMHLKRLYV
ncbi:hypothetical protein CQW23_26440 [Capsicum baccatum]|uniref:Uncharacterized protein n=1 Tax=Capsicum baccatum TaxID=33114 RepID=A0A2G2VNT0_CAPBA|nr:hypothetical protein CQW23_26440 [Capsicum baccatum]